jgi:hypothetical protein
MQCVSISSSLLTAGLLSSSPSHFTLCRIAYHQIGFGFVSAAPNLFQLLPIYVLHLVDTELQQFSRCVGSPVECKVRRKLSMSVAGCRPGTGNPRFDQNVSNSSTVVIPRDKHKFVAVNLQRIQSDTSGAHRGGGCSPAHPYHKE